MTRVSIIILYFCAICVLGCLIAYPVFLLTSADFERILSRSILILAVVLFYPAYRLLKIKSFSNLGFHSEHFISTLIRAWLLGVVMLTPITLYFFSCGARVLETTPPDGLEIISVLVSAIISGSIIGLIEESFFRGLLQSQLNAVMNPVWGIVVVSAIYSSLHFLQAPDIDPDSTLYWYSGFTLLFSAFANYSQVTKFMDAWIALFLAGLFLSLIRLRSNNIFWCIGIHAGWVAHIKVLKAFTDRNDNAICSTLSSNYDSFIGEFSAAWILLILVLWAGLHYARFKRAIYRE